MTYALMTTGLLAFAAFQAVGVVGGIVTIALRKHVFGQ